MTMMMIVVVAISTTAIVTMPGLITKITTATPRAIDSLFWRFGGGGYLLHTCCGEHSSGVGSVGSSVGTGARSVG